MEEDAHFLSTSLLYFVAWKTVRRDPRDKSWCEKNWFSFCFFFFQNIYNDAFCSSQWILIAAIFEYVLFSLRTIKTINEVLFFLRPNYFASKLISKSSRDFSPLVPGTFARISLIFRHSQQNWNKYIQNELSDFFLSLELINFQPFLVLAHI